MPCFGLNLCDLGCGYQAIMRHEQTPKANRPRIESLHAEDDTSVHSPRCVLYPRTSVNPWSMGSSLFFGPYGCDPSGYGASPSCFDPRRKAEKSNPASLSPPNSLPRGLFY